MLFEWNYPPPLHIFILYLYNIMEEEVVSTPVSEEAEAVVEAEAVEEEAVVEEEAAE